MGKAFTRNKKHCCFCFTEIGLKGIKLSRERYFHPQCYVGVKEAEKAEEEYKQVLKEKYGGQ